MSEPMQEATRIEIQGASVDQIEVFFDLWVPLMMSLESMGGDTRTTPRSVDFFRMLFTEYTTGRLPGVALLATAGGTPVGVLLWGSVPQTALDMKSSSGVFAWGAYTAVDYRQMGISRELRERAILDLHDMGVEKATGTAILTNTPGVESSRSIGFRPTQIMGDIDITAEARRLRDPKNESGPEPFFQTGHCVLCGRGE